MAGNGKKVGREVVPDFPRVIGGEIPLPPDDALLWGDVSGVGTPRSRLFSSANKDDILWLRFGRSAICTVMNIAGIDRQALVALPAYQCKAVIGKIHGSGRDLGFYQLNIDLTPDRDDILSVAGRAAAVITCGYFGSAAIDQSFSDLGRGLRDIPGRPWIIEDRAMAVADDDIVEQAGGRADFIFYSLRKIYPVPDGAPLIACSERAKEALSQWRKGGNGTLPDTKDDRFDKATGKKIKAKVKRHGWINHPPLTDAPDKNALQESMISEAMIEDIANDFDCDGLQGSRGSYSYLGGKNFNDDRQTVRANSRKLVDGLSDCLSGAFPIKDCVGIATPILVKNRKAFLATARAKGMFLPVHWPRDARVPCGGVAEHWYNNAVSLPILPESQQEDIDYMIEQLSHGTPF